MKTTKMVMQLLGSLGKEPLLRKVYVAEFIVNRIQKTIAPEAVALLDGDGLVWRRLIGPSKAFFWRQKGFPPLFRVS